MLEDLHIDAPVTADDGTHLGKLTRIVVDGASDRVLGIVVDPGLVASGNLLAPGGWERPRERVVPVSRIAAVSPDGVRLACDAGAFARLDLFEHERVVEASPAATSDRPAGAGGWRARFRLGELINYLASEFGLGGAPYVPPAAVTPDEPRAAGAIGAGTPVWRVEPHEHIGEVERVLIDPETRQVRDLVVRRGGAMRHLVLLPASAIAAIEDDMVRVRLSDDELRGLARFEAEP